MGLILTVIGVQMLIQGVGSAVTEIHKMGAGWVAGPGESYLGSRHGWEIYPRWSRGMRIDFFLEKIPYFSIVIYIRWCSDCFELSWMLHKEMTSRV